MTVLKRPSFTIGSLHVIEDFDDRRAVDWFAALDKRCGRLIETLPALQHDPNRPEDVLKVDADEDGVGGDDCADALRYLVGTKAREVFVRKLRGV